MTSGILWTSKSGEYRKLKSLFQLANCFDYDLQKGVLVKGLQCGSTGGWAIPKMGWEGKGGLT